MWISSEEGREGVVGREGQEVGREKKEVGEKQVDDLGGGEVPEVEPPEETSQARPTQWPSVQREVRKSKEKEEQDGRVGKRRVRKRILIERREWMG